MAIRALVTDPIDEEGIWVLRDAGISVDIRLNLSKEELLEAIADYDVLIVRSRTKVTKEVLDQAKRLKVIGRAGVGLDNIDIDEAERRGIVVVNTPEAPSESVAELTIGFMIALARKLYDANASMKEGKWEKSKFRGVELRGKTLGLIGCGNIGEKVARIAAAFGMRVLVKEKSEDIKGCKEVNAKEASLEELLRESDFLSIHATYSDETHHLINEERLRMMKPTAFLINTARGSIVDEKALLKALNEGWIAGAALDVYEVEPPTNTELIKHPKVICTPHIGSETREAQKAVGVMIAQRVIEALKSMGEI